MNDDFLKIVTAVQSTGQASGNQTNDVQTPIATSKTITESLDSTSKICHYGKDMSNETKRDSNT